MSGPDDAMSDLQLDDNIENEFDLAAKIKDVIESFIPKEKDTGKKGKKGAAEDEKQADDQPSKERAHSKSVSSSFTTGQNKNDEKLDRSIMK